MQNSLQHLLERRSGSILLAILFLALTAWAWVGFLGSDDVTYAIGAYGWIEQFPFVGGHGTIRYPITIPMAFSFLTFGHNEYAMVLPSYLAMVALLFCIWRSIVHISGVFPANLSHFHRYILCHSLPARLQVQSRALSDDRSRIFDDMGG